MESLNLSQDVIWRGTSSFANLSLEEVLTECFCCHQAESDTGTYSLSPWWRLQHSVETSTKSFFPNSVGTFLFRSQHVTHFTGPPFCKWQTLWWEGSGMIFTFFCCKYGIFYQHTLLLTSAYNPCTNLQCSAGQRCVISEESGASCVCRSLDECSQDKGQTVCGSDGRTYPSRCHLEVTACNNETSTYYKHTGNCLGMCFIQERYIVAIEAGN